MKPALQLYRRIIRVSRRLPEDAVNYYRQYAKENFVTFMDESDPDRILDLIKRGVDHTKWVLRKYEIDGQAAADLEGFLGANVANS
ncbi:hypothetical protein CBR_g972 [Chara braunii]|uniref:Complex 1 LYR protein domain-containing protein n=1 Tax=Chara braunii TaxID=69332 RepID=A0A388KCU5_CHABU|nr:hypothetical protein CBR_g972 [Chara braunii]|eukprot:GBG67851.1 hypothetical protein CBR_g972 [Chara braunii]